MNLNKIARSVSSGPLQTPMRELGDKYTQDTSRMEN